MTDVVSAAIRAASCAPEELPLVLRDLLADLVDQVPGATSAGLAAVSLPAGRLRSWIEADGDGAALDRLQGLAGQGPGVLAATTGEPVTTADVWADPRWELRSGADGPAVRSVVAVPLPGGDRGRTVLQVLSPADLTDPDAVERVLAVEPDLATTVSVVRARLEVADLQVALGTNRTIGAAIGVTMATRRLTYDDAAALLRRVSNNGNVRLGELAEQILFTGQVPEVSEDQAAASARGARASVPSTPTTA